MIEKYSFGKIVVTGNTYTSDIKIKNGKVISDWWRKSGHSVGIDDVMDLFGIMPTYLVLGKGKPGLMKADEQLRSRLEDLDIELIEEPTAMAVKIYNQLLVKGEIVAAGFHLTC